MSRLKSKTAASSIERLTGRVVVFHTRLGMYRYITVFKDMMYQGRRYVVIKYTGEIVNNRLYGEYTGMAIDDIPGKSISLYTVPTELIEDAIRGLFK